MSDLPAWKENKVARNRAYNEEHYARIMMMVPPDVKANLQAQAAKKGMSLTAYILYCAARVEAME